MYHCPWKEENHLNTEYFANPYLDLSDLRMLFDFCIYKEDPMVRSIIIHIGDCSWTEGALRA